MQTAAVPPAPAHPTPPDWASRLGAAGLIPFVAGAALLWLVWPEAHPYVALGLSAYAAVIVSFLGGIHWGVAMRAAAPAVTLLVCYAVDRRLYPRHGLAGWLSLRFRLSAVAASSCFLGAAGT